MFHIKISNPSYRQSHDQCFLTYSKLIFPGGEVQVRFDGLPPIYKNLWKDSEVNVTVSAHIPSSENIMELVMLVNAIRHDIPNIKKFNLVCPYLPYARQDRVCAQGEALGIKAFAGVINGLKFDSVEVWDAHSNVSLAVIDNIVNISPDNFLIGMSDSFKDCVLVAPDDGSVKKVSEVSKILKLPMITAGKHRDVMTGKITGTYVNTSEHIGKNNYLIVDDICDGGMTFIELAKVLRKWTDGKIYLYVTHGIFSRGLQVFDGLIDHVYVGKVFPTVDIMGNNITQLG